MQVDAGICVGSGEIEAGQIHANELAVLALARGNEEGNKRADLQACCVSAADRRAGQARRIDLEDLFRAGVEKPAMENCARVVAEPDRGGGLVERDDGARELTEIGCIERENRGAPLIVALLKERDLAFLQRADLRSVRIETEKDFDGSGRRRVGLPLIVVQRQRGCGERRRAQEEIAGLVIRPSDAELEAISAKIADNERNRLKECLAPCRAVVREAGPEATRIELREIERRRLRDADGRIVRVGESKQAGIIDLSVREVGYERSDGCERRASYALVRWRCNDAAETTARV